MIVVIRMIKINMIRRAVIKSDHPGRNCCRRSVVTTGGAVARYHLLLGGPLRPLLPHTNDYQWSTLPTLANTKSNADVLANKNDVSWEDPISMSLLRPMPVFAIDQQLQQNIEPTTAVLRSNSDYLSTSQPQLWGSPCFPSWMVHNMLARFPGHNAEWWCGTPDRLGRSQDWVYQLVAPSWLLTACFPSHDRFDTGKHGADGQICKGLNSVPGAVFRLNTQQ